MPKLPHVSGREARRAFERAGWQFARQRGDHILLTKPGLRTLVVPDYDELPSFIVRGLLRTAGLSVDEFVELL
jgi:predicted RNA binding protein YcfA (HicA-like mRNA interferase family)